MNAEEAVRKLERICLVTSHIEELHDVIKFIEEQDDIISGTEEMADDFADIINDQDDHYDQHHKLIDILCTAIEELRAEIAVLKVLDDCNTKLIGEDGDKIKDLEKSKEELIDTTNSLVWSLENHIRGLKEQIENLKKR